MPRVIDTNHDVSRFVPALRAAGVETVIRYITSAVSSEKCVRAPEAHNLQAGGLRLGLVYEAWGGTHGELSPALGRQHGEFSRDYAPRVGAPDGAVIQFAVDVDVSDSEIRSVTIPYFRAIRTALGGRFRCGSYACGAVCDALLDQGLVDVPWLAGAMGWNGSRAFAKSGRAVLIQGLPTSRLIPGLDLDPDSYALEPNDDLVSSVGYVPFSGESHVTPVPPESVHDARWMQRELNLRGADPKLLEDGNVGRLTVGAVISYLEKHPT